MKQAIKNSALLIEDIQKKLPFLRNERFQRDMSGTHHTVFVSKSYVIRWREDNSKILTRETKLLQKVAHPLIPKIILLILVRV